MTLTHLKLTQFRHFSTLDLHPHPQINLICGPNGSGKTNLLEAIYHLGVGKSFRTPLSSRVIQQGALHCQIYGCIEKAGFSTFVGIQRHRQEPTLLHLNHCSIASAAELANTFPLRLINPDSFNLLMGGPKHRRLLLNWGMFHVEHTFFSVWKQLQRVIKQRNAALKKGLRRQVKAWDSQLALCANELFVMNQRYFALFEPIFNEIRQQFLPFYDVKLKYYPGWDSEIPLSVCLESNYLRDQSRGMTHAGPHRADLRIRVGSMSAQDILSRGQQKLVVCTLLLAQGELLRRHLGIRCTYLLDDLSAELDEVNLKRVCLFLEKMDAQVFLTAVDSKLTADLFSSDRLRVFHVEHTQSIPASSS